MYVFVVENPPKPRVCVEKKNRCRWMIDPISNEGFGWGLLFALGRRDHSDIPESGRTLVKKVWLMSMVGLPKTGMIHCRKQAKCLVSGV